MKVFLQKKSHVGENVKISMWLNVFYPDQPTKYTRISRRARVKSTPFTFIHKNMTKTFVREYVYDI